MFLVINLYSKENIRLDRSPQSHARDTPKLKETVFSKEGYQGEINISTPNGHARQQDVTPDEDQHAKEPITIVDSTGEVALELKHTNSSSVQLNKQDRELDSVSEVDHHHSELEHVFDSIGEDDGDVDVARFLHSFGEDDNYEYEIDIDIEKTEYKLT